MLLQKNDFITEICHDGVAAVEILLERGDEFDVVFMDNMMPKMVNKILKLIIKLFFNHNI